MGKKKALEFEKFDRAMGELMKVPHSDIKVKLDAERAAKKNKRKAKKPSASGHDSGDTG